MNEKKSVSGPYARLFSRMYDPAMRSLENKVLQQRRSELLHNLSGHVLEVGAGTGINFSLYPAGVRVTGCEPSLPMLSLADERLEHASVKADIHLVHAGIGDEALEAHIPDSGLDAVVFTLVLCTIPDPLAAIRRVERWLKPGGRLLVLEHIGSDHPAGRFLQRMLEPVWTPLAEGCRLTRKTDELLREAGFEAEWERYFTVGIRFYQASLKKNALV